MNKVLRVAQPWNVPLRQERDQTHRRLVHGVGALGPEVLRVGEVVGNAGLAGLLGPDDQHFQFAGHGILILISRNAFCILLIYTKSIISISNTDEYIVYTE